MNRDRKTISEKREKEINKKLQALGLDLNIIGSGFNPFTEVYVNMHAPKDHRDEALKLLKELLPNFNVSKFKGTENSTNG